MTTLPALLSPPVALELIDELAESEILPPVAEPPFMTAPPDELELPLIDELDPSLPTAVKFAPAMIVMFAPAPLGPAALIATAEPLVILPLARLARDSPALILPAMRMSPPVL